MAKKKNEKLEPLEEIKRLIILNMMLSGITSDAIGVALELDGSVIRRMIPLGKTKRKK